MLSATAGAPRTQNVENVVPLGKLDRFWRFSAALGPYLETGNGLIDVPQYLLGGDFPYRKRPFPKEVLFADQLTIVRLLGGYLKPGLTEEELRALDLAYRANDGSIQYRMELLRARLQPYLENGYRDLTLVLDNVPYCFPAEPKTAGFGQIEPPSDPAEWKAFVREVVGEVVKIVGPEGASRLRFRIGTENNERDRFDGSQAQYERHYDDSTAAIREAISGAPVSFYNISKVNVRSIPSQNVNSFALAQHCFSKTPRSPIDFVAFSRYYWQQDDPEQAGRQCGEVWDAFGNLVPELSTSSREIQEFGTATWQMTSHGQVARAEPGALGAAQLLQMLFRLKQAKANRIWHWSVLDAQIRDSAGVQRSLPTGQAWIYSVLEYMAEGEAFLFQVPDRGDGVRRLAVGSWHEGSAVLIFSAYHPDGATRTASTIELQIPANMFGADARGVRIARLNGSNCVHSLVRNDLLARNLLGGAFADSPAFLGNVREMAASREGENFVADNAQPYLNAWTRSLTLRPFSQEDGVIQGRVFGVRVAAPEVVVVVLGS